MNCPKCGAENESDSKTCWSCQRTLPTSPAKSSAPKEPAKNEPPQKPAPGKELSFDEWKAKSGAKASEEKSDPNLEKIGAVMAIGVLIVVAAFILMPPPTSLANSLAKSQPEIQAFLSQHPSAAVSLYTYGPTNLALDREFWSSNCSSEIKEGNYILLKAEDTNSVYNALFDKDMLFVCGASQNKSKGGA